MADRISPPTKSVGKKDGLKGTGNMSTIDCGSFATPNKAGQVGEKGSKKIMGK